MFDNICLKTSYIDCVCYNLTIALRKQQSRHAHENPAQLEPIDDVSTDTLMTSVCYGDIANYDPIESYNCKATARYMLMTKFL